jgi:DNA-binding winged helix-turn-helix (wHTH) protein
MIDETTGCYEHNYLTACAVMLRKVLEDSIYLKFSMEGKLDTLYRDGMRLDLDGMIQKAKELHYITSQHAGRLAKIKLFGDAGAHSFKITLWNEDLEPCIDLIRLVLNELFYQNDIR